MHFHLNLLCSLFSLSTIPSLRVEYTYPLYHISRVFSTIFNIFLSLQFLVYLKICFNLRIGNFYLITKNVDLIIIGFIASALDLRISISSGNSFRSLTYAYQVAVSKERLFYQDFFICDPSSSSYQERKYFVCTFNSSIYDVARHHNSIICKI